MIKRSTTQNQRALAPQARKLRRSLRISSGSAKNRRLKVPNIEGMRAVQEKARHSIFSSIGERIEGSTCLDLFAGSGVMGIEALSRGAKSCDFVDENPVAVRVIIENIRNCGFDNETAQSNLSFDVCRSQSVKFIANNNKKYDFIFVDPFYEDFSHRFLVKNLGEVLNKNGLIFFLHRKDLNIKSLLEGSDLKLESERHFGKSFISVLNLTTS